MASGNLHLPYPPYGHVSLVACFVVPGGLLCCICVVVIAPDTQTHTLAGAVHVFTRARDVDLLRG